MSLCRLYWIKLPEYTDIFSQGYVGITTQSLDKRFYQHSKNKRSIVGNYINKHCCEIVEVLIGTQEYCAYLENKLRPSKRIGWNIVEGGGKPPIFNGPHCDEVLLKISECSKRSSNSPARIAASERRIGLKRPPHVVEKMRELRLSENPWETPRAIKEVWSIADKIHKVYLETGFGSIRLEQLFKLKKGSLTTIVEKFKKNNWNPATDNDWVLWLNKYKEIL